MTPSVSPAVDVAIVGSGPSGASAALRLAQSGLSVVLLDKAPFPRYKACGGGVVRRAARLLPFDIGEAIEHECQRIELKLLESNLTFAQERQRSIISMVMRSRFDQLLASAAREAGAKCLHQCEAQDIQPQNGCISLKTGRGWIKAQYIIAADGALSTIARKLYPTDQRLLFPALECEVVCAPGQFKSFAGCARFDFDLVPDGYGWIFPKSDHLSVGVLLMSRRRASLWQIFLRYLNLLKLDAPRSITPYGAIIPLASRSRPFMKNRVLLVGDAAGFADPLTGEGITAAILSGQIAADALINGRLEIERVQNIFESELEREILSELRFSLSLSRFVYRFPNMRTALFRIAGNKLAAAMTRVFSGERTYSEQLRDPVNYFKLFAPQTPSMQP
ncbi:NAD(P)/FAD-dependent oxidoreductase [candidate division KSB1 bacterium]|nr:NAD(P)/FAD-dependent oxidoreductase [candidate division KSB1 bacterium]